MPEQESGSSVLMSYSVFILLSSPASVSRSPSSRMPGSTLASPVSPIMATRGGRGASAECGRGRQIFGLMNILAIQQYQIRIRIQEG